MLLLLRWFCSFGTPSTSGTESEVSGDWDMGEEEDTSKAQVDSKELTFKHQFADWKQSETVTRMYTYILIHTYVLKFVCASLIKSKHSFWDWMYDV